ncbi:MAG: 2-hydroxyacyl-CoA dehydratase [Promethearchaeota archaeon]|nr:MAG: 2-hydroxyacyl-CoA dehydratase [Candidatus Lokiarchaeota archaeon]
MGRLSEDLVLNTGFLNLGLKFFDIERILRKIKRRKYKLITNRYPIFNEIIYSTDAFPLFTPRVPAIGDFNILKKALSSARLAEDVLGKKVASRGIGLVSDVLDRAILSQLEQIFKNFTKYVEVAEKSKLYLPCYATKLYYGSILQNKDIIDAVLTYKAPCIRVNESNEYASQIIEDTILLDIPKCQESDNSLDMMVEETQKFISNLENMAGPIDEDKVIEYTKMTNEIKELYNAFFDIFKKGDYLPIAPQSFRLMLSMLNSIFIDLISSPNHVIKNLTKLNNSLQKNLDEGKGYDASNSLRLFLLPSLGGFEYSIGDILAQNDAFLFYFDLYFYRLMEPIETTGDWVRNHAKMALQFNESWSSIDTVVNEWVQCIKNFNVDAVIFSDMSGCDYLVNAKDQFRSELEKSGIPMLSLPFTRLGENLETIESSIKSFLPTLRK